MEIKLIESYLLNNEIVYIVETKEVNEDGKRVSMVYDVRVEIRNGNIVTIRNVGVKTKRQKAFKYVDEITYNDYTYRRLRGRERTEYFMKVLMSKVPKEVLNFALREFEESIEVEYF